MKTQEDVEAFIPRDSERKDEFDVIVAGGGPAGIGAALASALNGAQTLILEGRSFFGGSRPGCPLDAGQSDHARWR